MTTESHPPSAIARRAVLKGATALAAGAAVLQSSRSGVAAAEVAPEEGALAVAAREIPVPKSISPEAQRFLAAGGKFLKMAGGPPSPTDKDAWRKRIAMINKATEPLIKRLLASPATVERKTVKGVSVCVGTPNEMRHKDRVRISIHGGAFTVMGGAYVEGDAAQVAAASGCTVYSIDYRMPPDFPFPAAVDDCVAVYREIIKTYEPKKVAISGGSAGGNLAGTVTLKIRDSGLPMPGAVAMLTPLTDLTDLSDTLRTNLGIDTALPRVPDAASALYADGHDLKDPYLSPLFGDFSKGFPPTYLQSGTRDLLLSDTVRMHAVLLNAGIEAELHVGEAMPHGGFGMFTPEDREMEARLLRFIDRHLG